MDNKRYFLQKNNNSKSVSIKTDGIYFQQLVKKHEQKFENVPLTNKVKNNVSKIFSDSLRMIGDGSRNMLLVGKVQSGKTSFLELLTGLAFDNQFNLLIIYGGYDDGLLNQTFLRFKNAFDFDKENCKVWTSSSSKENDKCVFNIKQDTILKLLDEKKKIIITCMKRPDALSKLNSILSNENIPNINAFIIDDETDQAGLNTSKDKKIRSATYDKICTMKKNLNNPLYFSVTATPEANIFLNEFSEIKPDMLRVIEPGIGYCGGNVFHMGYPDLIKTISDEDTGFENKMPDDLKDAINYFLCVSAIMYLNKQSKSDMIIHCSRLVDEHSHIYTNVDVYLKDIKNQVEVYRSDFKKIFESEKLQKNNDFDEIFKCIRSDILKDTRIILKNGQNSSSETDGNCYRHKIYIGGDLLSRGLTFDNLVVTYFTRWGKSSNNMDTSLQRARWFGYREKYVKLCRIYTTFEIQKSFADLIDIENDLWLQFNDVIEEHKKIEDILIKDPQEGKLRPTRKNVADYESYSFYTTWNKQNKGCSDLNLINELNNSTEKLFENLHFSDIFVGRDDGKRTGELANVDKKIFIEWLELNKRILLNKFVNGFYDNLIKAIDNQDSNINIIKMNSTQFPRERKFNANYEINNIFQGMSEADEFGQKKYTGDQGVVVGNDIINVQFHYIHPKEHDGRYCQWMMAIFLPKERCVWRKKV